VEIKESRAAQNLFKKVNSMISKLDTVLDGLEKHEKLLLEQVKQLPEEQKDKFEKIDQLVHIDELMLAIKQVNRNINVFSIFFIFQIK
jgi:LETM1 and EF-hand domain-containing protein 1, mitochondrial